MLSFDQFGFNAFWWERLWTEEELRSCFATIAGIGYKNVELKWDSFNPDEPMAGQLVRARRIAGEEGLRVSNFVILRDVIDPTRREQGIRDVTAYLRAVAESGVPVMNLVCGAIPKALSVDQAWDNVLSAFEEFVRVAEKCQVTLAFECIVGHLVHDYYTTREFLRHFDSEYLGLTLDPSHYQLYRNDIPWT
ncbi:MAG: sugar phosphate isomerase/epimerase, partial [Candidatus Latescibacterota bacterium]